MRIKVFYHDKCFDGASSAALFTRFYRERIRQHAEFEYQGLLHRAGALFNEDDFSGDENAIVDFKYSASPRITWWFDHHQSAFLTLTDAEHFQRDQSGKKFYDPSFRSCTKFIAHVAATKFNFCAPDLEEVIHWADIIDGAQYPDPKTAVEMRDAATQITLVIEGAPSNDFVAGLIPDLLSMPLAQIAALPQIRLAFERLYDQHLKTVDVIRERAVLQQGVVFLDLADQGFEGFNKFIPYYLFPESVYNVAVSRSRERIKIAVGSNPWNPTPKDANLASICERFGGGGHAKVAAISLPPDDLERGRAIAGEIVQELRSTLQ